MTIVYRSVQGSDLSAAQIDGNFHDVDDRVTTIEAAGIGVGIAFFEIPPGTHDLYVHMTDSSVLGPYTIPMPGFKDWFTGTWQAAYPYVVDNIFTQNGTVYVVIFDHTSGSIFDPNANDGSGHQYYAVLLTYPGMPILNVPATTFAPTLTHANNYVRCTNAAGCTVTIPLLTTVPFTIGTELHFRQAAAGVVEVVAEAGVILNGVTGFFNMTAVQGSVISLKKITDNSWDVFGGLLATS